MLPEEWHCRSGLLGSLLSVVLIALLLSACQEQEDGVELEGNHPIPRLPIALRVSLDHEGRILQDPYSFMTFTEPRYVGELLGHMGVVVVHGIGAEYVAYDLACPYCWPEQQVAVAVGQQPDRGILVAECPTCHTLYDLALGLANPIGGPGRYPLLSYRIQFVGSTLLIY